MTLKEKFRKVFKEHFTKGKEEELLLMDVDSDLEQVADEFAIEFAEWLDTLIDRFGLLEYKRNYMNKTKKELLEIYKKEKGL
jgi:hypothetical protein